MEELVNYINDKNNCALLVWHIQVYLNWVLHDLQLCSDEYCDALIITAQYHQFQLY